MPSWRMTWHKPNSATGTMAKVNWGRFYLVWPLIEYTTFGLIGSDRLLVATNGSWPTSISSLRWCCSWAKPAEPRFENPARSKTRLLSVLLWMKPTFGVPCARSTATKDPIVCKAQRFREVWLVLHVSLDNSIEDEYRWFPMLKCASGVL